MSGRTRRLVVPPDGGAVTVDSLSPPHESGEILVLAPEFVGVCGTDLDIITRSRSDKAAVLGHEAVVRIIGRPSTVTHKDSLANSYIINPVNAKNQEQIVGHSEEGMLQEAVEIPASRLWDGLLVAIVPGLDPLLAVLSEPLGVAVYCIELLALQGLPERLLVLGAGPMGLLTVVAARLLGVPEVAVIDLSEQRIQYAIKSGLVEDRLALCRGSGPAFWARTLYGGSGPDAVALCVGREQRRVALHDAIRVASADARIDLITGFMTGETLSQIPGVDVNKIRRLNVCGRPLPGYIQSVETKTGKCLRLTGHRGTSPQHLANAMKMLRDHASLFRKLITDVVKIEDAPQVIDSLLRQRRDPGRAPYRKVVISLRSS